MLTIEKDTTEISSALQCLIRYAIILKRDTPDLKDMFDGICALGVEAGKDVQPLLLPKSDKILKESTSGKSSCSSVRPGFSETTQHLFICQVLHQNISVSLASSDPKWSARCFH